MKAKTQSARPPVKEDGPELPELNAGQNVGMRRWISLSSPLA